VVSKYIGETAKHLSEIFSAPRGCRRFALRRSRRAVAKRTQIRIRTIDTRTPTPAISSAPGRVPRVGALTTNKRGNIDPAFYRRLRYVYEFPKPGPSERLEIWQRLTKELYGQEVGASLSSTQKMLAEQMAISPAQIKATLLASAFIAQRQGSGIQSSHLLKALEREMAKEGRGVDEHIKSASIKFYEQAPALHIRHLRCAFLARRSRTERAWRAN